jgi:hypothetical protein
MRNLTRRMTPPVALVAVAASLALTAAPASAKTTTLHFFQKETSVEFLGSDGKPTAPPSGSNAPAVGDQFVSTDDDYVGNHKHHAAKATASDHIACTFTDTLGHATCSAQIAIGGSLLLADNVALNLASDNTVVPITGGTLVYKHAHGTATSVTIGNSNNSDFTVKITT